MAQIAASWRFEAAFIYLLQGGRKYQQLLTKISKHFCLIFAVPIPVLNHICSAMWLLCRFKEFELKLPDEVLAGVLKMKDTPDEPENIQIAVHHGQYEELFAMATIDFSDIKELVSSFGYASNVFLQQISHIR